MPTEKELLYSDAAYSYTPAERSAWQKMIDAWRAKANEFDIAVAQLRMQLNDPAVQADPQLYAEAQRLWTKSETIAPKVQAIRAAVDDVIAAMNNAWDYVSGAWDAAADWIGLGGLQRVGTLGGLGIPALIPIAAVAAAIAVITAFLVDYAKFARSADLARQRGVAYQAAIDQGHSPSEALAISQGAVPDVRDPGGIFALGVGGIPLWLLALGGLGAYLFFGNKRRP